MGATRQAAWGGSISELNVSAGLPDQGGGGGRGGVEKLDLVLWLLQICTCCQLSRADHADPISVTPPAPCLQSPHPDCLSSWTEMFSPPVL